MSKVILSYENGTAGTSGVAGKVEIFVTEDRKLVTHDNDGVIFDSSKSTEYVVQENVTLDYTGFTLNTGTTLYEYVLTNSNIKISSLVDYVPYNSSITAVIDMELLPYTEVTNGQVKFTCKIQPTADVVGQLIIFN